MTKEEIYATLDKVFQEVFEDDSIHVGPETTANDIEDWDSLEHINLVVAIEKQFQMKFTMGEITTMKNVGEMVEILQNRGGCEIANGDHVLFLSRIFRNYRGHLLSAA